MIGLRVAVQAGQTAKMLSDVYRKDIPAAKAAAFKRAGASAKSQATRNLARGAHVAQKFVRGRIGVGKYNRRLDGIALYLRHTHINPAGTKKHPQALATNYRITKRGHYGKGHGDFKAMGRTYSNRTHHLYSERFQVPLILRENPNGGNTPERIQLGSWAENSLKNTARRIVPQVFEKRFVHELRRRAARRGNRVF